MALGDRMGVGDGGEGSASEDNGRILLVDDDPALGGYLRRVLSSRGFEVVHELDSEGALQRIMTAHFDLLISDIELPGMNGLELLERARQVAPGLPVALLTGHPSVDYAVTALRGSAAEFLLKPVSATELIAKATALIEAGRAALAAGRETVLAIGAHPDDVEIGAGGTLLAHSAGGDSVAILTLSRGARGGDRLFLDDLDDRCIPEGGPAIDAISQVIAEVQPGIVYTHSVNDVHQDHRNTHRAAMVACRRVGRVYCFQSPSATIDYHPTRFVPVDGYLGRKLKVIGVFGSQAGIRDYLDPDLTTSTARYWARYCDSVHAEPFEVIRDRSQAPASGAAGADPEEWR
jgi:two-component system, NtrC family, response regulator HydG